MPYLYLDVEADRSAVTDPLQVLLDQAGVNLLLSPPVPGQDAVRLILHHRPHREPGAMVFYGPAGASLRFSYCLTASLRRLPQLTGRVFHRAGSAGGGLMPSRVPSVLAVLGGVTRIPPEPLARALAEAAANHFRLPRIAPQPEEPVCLRTGQAVPLLRFPSALSGAYHIIPAADRLSILGSFGSYVLARHAETVGFLLREQVKI